jgi:Flp pilus assembly secretin CpaC
MKRTFAAIGLGLLLAPLTAASADDGFLVVGLGRISVVHSKQAIATVAVGDPAIADVAIEGEGSVLVFGKKQGQTDLVLMNGAHQAIVSSHILVGPAGGSDGIIVRRPGKDGITAESWYCAPECQPFDGGSEKK